MFGLKLAALYSLPAFKLGFCGPREKSATRLFLNYLSNKKISEKKIRKILKKFKGAYSYYCLIAKSSGIKDPFNEKVVKAYWIGNNLLEKVKINDLRRMVAKDLSKPGLLSKEIALKKTQKIPDGSIPHHSFHVFIIGSVTGKISLKGKLLNLCRISWGRVIKLKIKNEKLAPYRNEVSGVGLKILVEYQPLIKNKNFRLGKPIEKEIIWDKILVPKIKIGDWVSIHWNNLVQKLNKEDLKNLKKYTQITLKALAKIS